MRSRPRGRRVPGTVRAMLAAAVAIVALAVVTPAVAHHQGVPHDGPAHDRPADAIVIPNLSHGQMGVIADNKSAILDLADRQIPTDPVMRRLQAFVNLQVFACVWGVVPGSFDDEASPFNECAHAYLAGTRALLLHLQTMPGDRSAVRALVGKIEREMLDKRSSLFMCRYSDEPFDTSSLVAPHWGAIVFHMPSLLTLGSLLMVTIACGAVCRRPRPPALTSSA